MQAKQIVRIVLNFLIAAGFIIIAVYMFFKNSDGMLSSSGLSGMKYFTTLSNMLEAVVALIWGIHALAKKGKPSKVLEGLKFIAAVQVFVTFMTIVAFLGPVYGYVKTCSGHLLWLHIIIPLASILEQIFLSDSRVGIKWNLFAVIPPLVYGTVYVINILINGKGVYPNTNDWYGFLNWGPVIGGLIFFFICVGAFLLGLILRGFWRISHRRKIDEALKID